MQGHWRFLEDRICDVAEITNTCPALDLRLLLNIGTNGTTKEHMKQIKGAYRELWGKKCDEETQLTSSLILQVKGNAQVRVHVPCKLKADSMVSAAGSALVFMTIVSFVFNSVNQ